MHKGKRCKTEKSACNSVRVLNVTDKIFVGKVKSKAHCIAYGSAIYHGIANGKKAVHVIVCIIHSYEVDLTTGPCWPNEFD